MPQVANEMEVPSGGIAGFLMSDEDFSELERKETEKQFGKSGIAQFQEHARKMAGYGRFGDDSVAHIQTGEIVVPLALVENNPDLKEQIFQNLRDNGVEDPEQYVVGSSANSINPETGMMEFGFFGKVFKGIKRHLSKVVKLAKKAAPIVLPIALALTPLGPIYGAALGAGLGSLIQGRSIKDSLKAGLIAGATGGLFQGVSGAGSFSENVSGALANPFSAGTAAAAPGVPAGAASPAGAPATAAPAFSPTAAAQGAPSASNFIAPKPAPGFFESIKGAVTPGDGVGFSEGLKNAFLPKSSLTTAAGDVIASPNATDILQANSINPLQATPQQVATAESLARQASPGLARTYAPIGVPIAAATGMFSTPEQEPLNLGNRDAEGNLITGQTLLEQNPEKYLVRGLGGGPRQPAQAPTTSPTHRLGPQGAASSYRYASPYINPLEYPVMRSEGGPIYPRRSGGIHPDEGVPGQDSVRALLTPGEFVMTEKAVRGVGGGDTQQGIRNMYSIMRDLESRGRAA